MLELTALTLLTTSAWCAGEPVAAAGAAVVGGGERPDGGPVEPPILRPTRPPSVSAGPPSP